MTTFCLSHSVSCLPHLPYLYHTSRVKVLLTSATAHPGPIFHSDHCSSLLILLTPLPSLLNIVSSRVTLSKYQSDQVSPCSESSQSSHPRTKAKSLPDFLTIWALIISLATLPFHFYAHHSLLSVCRAPGPLHPLLHLPPMVFPQTTGLLPSLLASNLDSKFTFTSGLKFKPTLTLHPPSYFIFFLSTYHCACCLLIISPH